MTGMGEATAVDELDQLYILLLHRGLVAIRNASSSGDLEFCKAVSEYLHEVPSLIGETNTRRHIYQATKVRPAFLEWVSAAARDDIHDFVGFWFASVWKRIDELLRIEPDVAHPAHP
jgi:hypothetical protein